MPQFDFYSFAHQVFLFLSSFLLFYYIYLKYFLVYSSRILKIRTKIFSIIFNKDKDVEQNTKNFLKKFF